MAFNLTATTTCLLFSSKGRTPHLPPSTHNTGRTTNTRVRLTILLTTNIFEIFDKFSLATRVWFLPLSPGHSFSLFLATSAPSSEHVLFRMFSVLGVYTYRAFLHNSLFTTTFSIWILQEGFHRVSLRRYVVLKSIRSSTVEKL